MKIHHLKQLRIGKLDGTAIFLAASSGFLLTLSFPRAGISFLAWIALVPLFVVLKDRSFKNAFPMGLLTGLAHYLTLFYWLAHTMSTYGHLPIYVSLPVLFLLSFYLALYIALFSTAVASLCPSPFSIIFTAPVVWVSLEYIRSFILTGFPWELLGYTQFNILHIIQISDIFGVYGVSFCIVLVNSAMFLIYLALTNKNWREKNIRIKQAVFIAAAIAAILAVVWGYGNRRMHRVHELAVNSPSVNIAVIQGNIDQAKKWDPAFQRSSTIKYIRLSLSSKKFHPDLVVWPETATPFYFTKNTELSNLVLSGIREIGADFLIGSPAFDFEKNKVQYYNSAFLVDAAGNVVGRYDKSHLVPFGEYVPLKRWLPFVGKIVENVGDFRAGEVGRVLKWKKFRIGVLICYEGIFPPLARAMVQNQASILFNLTNDAWYGKSSAPYQHFSMVIFRAVENRRSLVRAANTGISCFIDPSGNVTKATRIFKDAVITQKVPILQMKTFYSKFGDVFAMACLGLSVVFIIFRSVKF